MKKANLKTTCGLVVFGTFIWLQPPLGAQVDCDKEPPGVLQRAIDAAGPGDTLLVSGTCNENVTIPEGKSRITLDGGGKATINGPDANENTVSVTGRGITIKGFRITGGLDGIRVQRGGTATIEGNTIEKTGRDGITVTEFAFAAMADNKVQYNPRIGIVVNGSSFAHIGFLTIRREAPPPRNPNVVQYNSSFGILVERTSSARIAGNDIRNNGRSGIWIHGVSQANISDNTIDANTEDGIFVSEGSGATLPQAIGNTILMRPNQTIINNMGFGIQCHTGGYTTGRLHSLTGDRGAESHSEGCFSSLTR